MTQTERTVIIEDNREVCEDINIELKKRGETLNLEPESYYDLLFAVFYEPINGVIIDIDLSSFDLVPIFTGESFRIENGIGLAKFIHEYNPNLPVAVYSADIERFETELKDLPTSIEVYKKDTDFWTDSLPTFCNKVETEQKFREINTSHKSLKFYQYNDIQKLHEIRKASVRINGNKYFEAMGNYAWFIECGGIAKKYHGCVIGEHEDCSISNSEILNEYQKQLAEKNDIDTIPNLSTEILLKLSEGNNQVPIIHWNFTTPENLKAIQQYYKYFAFEHQNRPLPEYRKKAYYHELAEHLAKFYTTKNNDKKLSKHQVINILNELPDMDKQYLKLNFAKEIFSTFRLDLKRGDKDIGDIRRDVVETTGISIEDIFICKIVEVDEVKDAATVKMKHLYRKNADALEVLSLKFLKENTGDIATLYTKFEYIVYVPAIGGGAFKINLLT